MIPYDLVNQHVLEVNEERIETDVLILQLIEVIVEHYWSMTIRTCERLHVVSQQVRLATLRWTSDEHEIACVDVG